MGICTSCDSTSVATVKLVSHDGMLQEFSCPVKVSHVLEKNPACFICDSDEMDIDDVISAVSCDEELRMGQLYFALPLSRLQRRLQAEEMAALAVKASAALDRSGHGNSGCRRSTLVFPVESNVSVRSRKSGEGGSGSRRRRGDRGAGRRRAKFSAQLVAIPE